MTTPLLDHAVRMHGLQKSFGAVRVLHGVENDAIRRLRCRQVPRRHLDHEKQRHTVDERRQRLEQRMRQTHAPITVYARPDLCHFGVLQRRFRCHANKRLSERVEIGVGQVHAFEQRLAEFAPLRIRLRQLF